MIVKINIDSESNECLPTGAAQQATLKRSWNKPWKKPKQEDQAGTEPARGTLKPTLAAIQQSVPQPAAADAETVSTPRRGLVEALTPRRGSGESTPRGKAALSSPFLKSVQELFSSGLRRSGNSNLGPPVPSAEPAETQQDGFSPLSGGMSAEKPISSSTEPLSSAAEVTAAVNEERQFASQLASEAADSKAQCKGRFSLSRRKSKSPSPASPQPQTPVQSPKPATPGLPAAEETLATSAAATAMTMGAPDIALQRKKALRSPKRTVAGGVITHRSGERPQPRIPEASPAPAQPSPTLLSIQKLMAKQAASVGALQETGRAQAVAEALEAPSEPAGPSHFLPQSPSACFCAGCTWFRLVVRPA